MHRSFEDEPQGFDGVMGPSAALGSKPGLEADEAVAAG